MAPTPEDSTDQPACEDTHILEQQRPSNSNIFINHTSLSVPCPSCPYCGKPAVLAIIIIIKEIKLNDYCIQTRLNIHYHG
jgi:hypothetical protein